MLLSIRNCALGLRNKLLVNEFLFIYLIFLIFLGSLENQVLLPIEVLKIFEDKKQMEIEKL